MDFEYATHTLVFGASIYNRKVGNGRKFALYQLFIATSWGEAKHDLKAHGIVEDSPNIYKHTVPKLGS